LLGPKSQVDAANGYFPWPFTAPAPAPTIGRRLQVAQTDLANAGALYFVQGQYIQFQDATMGNGNNNASYRRVTVNASTFNLTLQESVHRTIPAIWAWHDHGGGVNVADPDVQTSNIDVPDDGRFILASKVTDLGGGMYHYEYAIENLNSNRNGGAFVINVPVNAAVTNIGFHGVLYHSGEIYDNTDWTGARSGGTVTWQSPQTFAENPDSNALRWATLYNFRFDSDAAPDAALGQATLVLFKPGTPDSMTGAAHVPFIAQCPCDWNHDGMLGSQDFFDYVSDFFNSQGDYNHDGITNSADFFEFLQCFFAGCAG
jgi:hypothetical protein